MYDEINYVQVKATNIEDRRDGARVLLYYPGERENKYVHCNMAISLHRCVRSRVYESKWIPNVGEKEVASGKCGQSR
jgi:hypothetical protein